MVVKVLEDHCFLNLQFFKYTKRSLRKTTPDEPYGVIENSGIINPRQATLSRPFTAEKHAARLSYILEDLYLLLSRFYANRNNQKPPIDCRNNYHNTFGQGTQVVMYFSGVHHHLRTFTRRIYRRQASFRQIQA